MQEIIWIFIWKTTIILELNLISLADLRTDPNYNDEIWLKTSWMAEMSWFISIFGIKMMNYQTKNYRWNDQ